MRQRNWRLVIVGVVLVLAVPAFFFYFLGKAPKSNDPAALMQTVGQVAGVVGAIGLVMLIFGLIGKKR
jgi:predicted permease